MAPVMLLVDLAVILVWMVPTNRKPDRDNVT
jgi:hypothetical protein